MCCTSVNEIDYGFFSPLSSYEKPPPGLIKVSVKFLLWALHRHIRLSNLLCKQLHKVLNLLL